jgi:hypothetical protein
MGKFLGSAHSFSPVCNTFDYQQNQSDQKYANKEKRDV